MRTTAIRRDDGAPLRDVMAHRKLGCGRLAKLIRQADPEGKGVSWQLLAYLATDRPWARTSTRPETARMIEQALQVEPGTLFEFVEVPEKSDGR